MGLTTAPGVRQDPLSGFRFTVDFLKNIGTSTGSTTDSLGFKTVSGLEREVEVVEYREGDDGVGVRKLPGLVVHPNITLERGVARTKAIVEWFEEVVQYDLSKTRTGSAVSKTATPGGTSADPPNYARRVTVTMEGRGGVPVRTWVLTEAWPTKLTWEDLDAESSDILIQTLELAYAYMEVT